jgi:ferric-dicitrate binding protein FerR (iron transport regulator)
MEAKHGKSMDSNKFNPWKLLKVAAVLVPFIIAAVLFVFYRQATEPQPKLAHQIIEKTIPRGQKLTVFLSDGSKVILNSESSIKYAKPFGKNQRIVELEGEAFFHVTPDKARPFVVKTVTMKTKVVGTSFNIKAYSTDNTISVAVRSGQVLVEDISQKSSEKPPKSMMLSHSEMATYSLETHEISVSGYDPKEVLGWSDGTLYFDGAHMDEFISKIERWYGVEVQVKRKETIKKGIVGEFHDQSLEEILMGIHESCEFDYEIHGDKVIIK